MLNLNLDPQLLRLAEILTSRRKPSEIPPADWPALIQSAIRQQVGPVLWHVLKSAGFSLGADNDHWGRLARVARQTAGQYALLESAQQQVEEALRQANIPTIWLKGIVLAQTIYADPTYRPMGDLDVLVPFQLRDQALDILIAQGYDFRRDDYLPFASDDPLVLLLSHHFHLVGGPANTLIVELHYRLLSNDNVMLPLHDLEWFWGQVQTVAGDRVRFNALTPEAHLLYLCSHAELQHGEADFQVLRYFDMHQLITQSSLDWDLIRDQAAALRWSYALDRALGLTQHLFATPLPDTLFNQLRGTVDQNPDEVSRVMRFQHAGARSEKLLARLAMLPAKHKWRYVRSFIFPSQQYMRVRYAVAHDQPVWPYYFRRWKNFLADVWNSIRTRMSKGIKIQVL